MYPNIILTNRLQVFTILYLNNTGNTSNAVTLLNVQSMLCILNNIGGLIKFYEHNFTYVSFYTKYIHW